MRRRAIPKGLSQMQRVTITLDDDLLETLDSLSQRRGYNNRSEAIRDILRGALAQEATQEHGTQGFAVLSYVYEHEKRDLASRIVSTQHHHHDLSVATLHVHINHDDCLEIAVLKGDMGDVQHLPMMLSPSAACATATCSVYRKKTNAPAPCRGRFACPAYARTSVVCRPDEAQPPSGNNVYAIVPIVFLKRNSAIRKNTPPIASRVRNCGQTILKPAPR